VLVSMVILDHALLCSLRYIDYDSRKYTRFSVASTITLNVIGVVMVFLMRFGIDTPILLNFIYSGVALIIAVICYIANFKLKKKKHSKSK
jgi:predicted membrane channel-forming protein YqfA (hemolysin III family)